MKCLNCLVYNCFKFLGEGMLNELGKYLFRGDHKRKQFKRHLDLMNHIGEGEDEQALYPFIVGQIIKDWMAEVELRPADVSLRINRDWTVLDHILNGTLPDQELQELLPAVLEAVEMPFNAQEFNDRLHEQIDRHVEFGDNFNFEVFYRLDGNEPDPGVYFDYLSLL